MAGVNYEIRILSSGLRALVAGHGPVIVCVAGWPQTAEAFLDVLPALSQEHKVFVLDPPGLGDSAPSSEGYDTQTVSKILQTAIRNEIGQSTRYHLVGHDVGAWIAFSWAALDRQHLRSVTLMDATILGFVPKSTFPLPYEANIKSFQFAFNRLPNLPEILTAGRERELLNWLFDQKSVHPERITQARRDIYVDAYSRPGAMSRGFAYYRDFIAGAEANQRAMAKELLNVPVLTVGGDHAAGEAMKPVPANVTKQTSLSRSISLEGCGHYLMEEQPEACARTILDFIRDIETA
ncbi:alpha/beta-hydrolase [Sarocladium strictum]